jgi:hypothetical protein
MALRKISAFVAQFAIASCSDLALSAADMVEVRLLEAMAECFVEQAPGPGPELMNYEVLNTDAPITPGKSAAGLELGQDLSEVLAKLGPVRHWTGILPSQSSILTSKKIVVIKIK